MPAAIFDRRQIRRTLMGAIGLSLAGLSLVGLGCRPEPATTTATPDPGSTTAATDVAPAPEPDPEPDPEADSGPTAGELAAPPQGGDEGADEGAGEDPGEGGETTTAEGTTVAAANEFAAPDPETAKKELPKPIYKAGGGKCQKTFSVGEKVKGFKLPSVDGKKNISPSSYRGRVVLLNFWGTWCKPCLEELPKFDRIYRKYRNHGMTLVAVATDEDAKPVQDFIDKHKLIAKVALAGEEVAGAYNRPNFPFSFVIDESGKIIAAYEFVDDSCLGDLEQVIRTELEN